MRPAVVLLVSLVLAAAAVDDGCFNTLFYARPAAIDVAVPISCANAWTSNQRAIHAAHVDDAVGRATLLASYASEPSALLLERFNTTTGAAIDTVALHGGAANVVAGCTTAYDVWAATGDGALIHWDAVSGQRRAVSTQDAIAASQRVWLACAADRAWVSVPAARAVWEIDPIDARVVRVVARLASPNVLATDGARLWVIDGQPGVTAWAIDVANASVGLRATPLPPDMPITDAAVRSDGALLVMDGAGNYRVVAAAGAPQPASLELSYAPEVRALASATCGVRGAGALVDVHSGRLRVPPLTPLGNNGNLAALAYRPIPLAPASVRVVGIDGGVATLGVPMLNASGPCAALVHEEWERPLTSTGAVHVLDVALDGSIVWYDSTTGLLRVRFGGTDADVLLPAAPLHAQVRAIGGPAPAVCILDDAAFECRDLLGGIVPEPVSVAAPAADGLVMQWDGPDAIVLFGVTDTVVDVWRATRPFGAPPALRCTLDMRKTGEARQPAYWGVAPIGDGGFLMRWTADVALVFDGNCTVRAIVDALRPEAQPTLAYAATVTGDEVCLTTDRTRPVRLPRRGAGAWIAAGSLLFVLCFTTAMLACVCIAAPRAVWQRYTRGNGPVWKRFGVKRRSFRSLCTLGHDTQSSVYTLVSCLCPCIADWLHARLQRWHTPVVFEGTAPGLAGNEVAENAAVLLAQPDDDRWVEMAERLDDEEIREDIRRRVSTPPPNFAALAARMTNE